MLEIEELMEETVVHKSFGKGVVKSANVNYLEVDFPGKNKKSTFAYPLCFDGFLTLENEENRQKCRKPWSNGR